jgi:hypothetical protein
MARAKNNSAQPARIEGPPGESNSERGSGQAPTDQCLDTGEPVRAAPSTHHQKKPILLIRSQPLLTLYFIQYPFKIILRFWKKM